MIDKILYLLNPASLINEYTIDSGITVPVSAEPWMWSKAYGKQWSKLKQYK